MNLDPKELELRKQTYAWIRSKFLADDAAVAEAAVDVAARKEQAPAALDLVERLRVTRDAVGFKEALSKLTSPRDSRLSLSGPNGQMVVNQIVDTSLDPARAGEILGRVLQPPSDDDDAAAKINELIAYCTEIKTGSHPQTGRVAPLLSVFWILADETWPARWATAATSFERLGWSVSDDLAEGYLDFATMIRALGPSEEVLSTFHWYAKSPWPGPDPVLEQRVAWAGELRADGRLSDPVAYANAEAMLGPLRQAGDDLNEAVGNALDRVVTKKLAPKEQTEGGVKQARRDVFVRWSAPAVDGDWAVAPAYRLWFSPRGVMMALHPGYRASGWIVRAKPRIEAILPAGISIVDHAQVAARSDLKDEQRDFFIGRFFSYDEFDWESATEVLIDTAARLLPVLQTILTEGPGWAVDQPGEPDDSDGSEMRSLFAEFVADTGYPTAVDVEQQANREPLAGLLAKGALGALDVTEFRRLQNSPKYGFAGNRMSLNQTLANPDEEVVQTLVVETVGDLLYGPGEFGERIDRATKQLSGLGQAGAAKLLALVYPERFLPIYPLVGPSGKMAVLPFVGVETVPAGTHGERSVAANDLIRRALSVVPELVEDPWGQMMFAYWLTKRDVAIEEDSTSLEARLADATDACTLPPNSPFLGELVGLLEDKGQIVLYGPPGTGKTYLALKLAEALAPDDDRRGLVQFHPSMAYEDFMEGFRPVLREGNLTYELAEGPLIELANRAAVDDRPHVLIIDEMNRANLPKVFGELLFLLEYRDRPTKLAYRASGDAFSLPKNLWIIGTMNLADRSVGQIDAALRRRFAFVPFTPSDEHNGGLLRRWLAKGNQPTWPADLVDEVNSELEQQLGHADLLIGPSYFMKEGLDAERMAVIWRYAIEPLVSDLFHGDDKLVRSFGWSAVTTRHRALLPAGDAPADPAGPLEAGAGPAGPDPGGSSQPDGQGE